MSAVTRELVAFNLKLVQYDRLKHLKRKDPVPLSNSLGRTSIDRPKRVCNYSISENGTAGRHRPDLLNQGHGLPHTTTDGLSGDHEHSDLQTPFVCRT
jgi:hypothetical protein